MTLPALDLLAANGYAVTLAGRRWANDLFAAYPWPTLALQASRIDRVRALRKFGGTVGLLMTNSFSTALDFRLAGIQSVGYARDGRSWLLRNAVAARTSDHMVESYYRLAAEMVGPAQQAPQTPRDLQLRVGAAARQRAHEVLAAHAARAPYVVLCPVAVGLHRGRVKAWEGFARLSRELLELGIVVVAMPGPQETAHVRDVLTGAVVLPESDIATFAAVLAGARLVVANDSGPGHLAAAVGAQLVSVFGVTDASKTRPWSTRATMVGSEAGWPAYAEVRSAVDAALRA